MMKRTILSAAMLLTLAWTASVQAGGYGFESSAENIARKLAAPIDEREQNQAPERSLGSMFEADDGPASLPRCGPPPGYQAKMRAMRVMVRRPGEEIPVARQIEVPVDPRRRPASVNLKIEFEVNAHAIRPDSESILDQLGQALQMEGVRHCKIAINGHTDADGSDQSNLTLSLKRAYSVKRYLMTHHGIGEDRLRVVGYGEGMPLAANSSRKNKQLNRRVEIVSE
ncbi:MAG: OmpA family protein [Magnetococcales bacterium]|nr:OmpA family protein [Magnetococcales bacterium]